MPKVAYRPRGIDNRLLFGETVEEITYELKAIYGNTMCVSDFCKYYHNCGRDTARKILKGIPYTKNGIDGRKKYYRTLDIARALAENQFAVS